MQLQSHMAVTDHAIGTHWGLHSEIAPPGLFLESSSQRYFKLLKVLYRSSSSDHLRSHIFYLVLQVAIWVHWNMAISYSIWWSFLLGKRIIQSHNKLIRCFCHQCVIRDHACITPFRIYSIWSLHAASQSFLFSYCAPSGGFSYPKC